MARIYPFRALQQAQPDAIAGRLAAPGERPTTSADELHASRLLAAPDPLEALRRLKSRGELVELPTGLHLLECQPEARTLLRRSPARFVLGALEAEELEPLEAVAVRPERPSLQPLTVLAADDHQVLRTLLAEAVGEGFPAWEGMSNGTRYRAWRLEGGSLVRRLRAALEGAPIRAHGQVIPRAGRVLAAVAPLSDPGLDRLPYHRAVRGLPNFEPSRFLTLVAEYARVIDLDAPLEDARGIDRAREQLATLSGTTHGVLLVLPGRRGAILRFRQALELALIPAAPRSPTLRSLDLALLNALVLRTVLGIPDPDAPAHPNVFQVDSLEELVSQVDAGAFQVGFGLNAPPLWELRAVIEAGQRLPPLTFRLEPQPPTGLVFFDPAG
jgi:hypothetical protein